MTSRLGTGKLLTFFLQCMLVPFYSPLNQLTFQPVQEIAMNVVWTRMEYENMTQGHLDYGTTMTSQSVCEVYHHHLFFL